MKKNQISLVFICSTCIFIYKPLFLLFLSIMTKDAFIFFQVRTSMCFTTHVAETIHVSTEIFFIYIFSYF